MGQEPYLGVHQAIQVAKMRIYCQWWLFDIVLLASPLSNCRVLLSTGSVSLYVKMSVCTFLLTYNCNYIGISDIAKNVLLESGICRYQTVRSYCLSRNWRAPPKMPPLKTTLETYCTSEQKSPLRIILVHLTWNISLITYWWPDIEF